MGTLKNNSIAQYAEKSKKGTFNDSLKIVWIGPQTPPTYIVGKEPFIRFRKNEYKKRDGQPFLSIANYLVCINTFLKLVGLSEESFYSNNRKVYFEIWRKKIEDRLSCDLNGSDAKKKDTAKDILCAYDSYVGFTEHQKTQALRANSTRHLMQAI